MNDKEVSARLRAVFDAKGVTQSQAASKLGITQSMVSQYLNGQKSMPDAVLRKFSVLLGIEPGWLEHGAPPAPEILLREVFRKSQWVFRKQHLDGGKEYGNADVWAIPWNLETLVREVIQNILDARQSEEIPVSVDFSVIELAGLERDRFLRAIDLQGEDGTPSFLEHLQASVGGGNKIAKDLRAGLMRLIKSKSLFLLRIEDRGTTGLTGGEYEEGNYTALVRNLLDTQKSSAGSGGAYGLGKAVLWRASMVSAVLFNSIPKELVEGGLQMRLIGKVDLPHHETKEDAFAGPGWFGYGDERDQGEIVAARSIRDSLELADELYIRRDPIEENIGTSILIIGFYDPSSDDEVSLHQASEKIQAAAARNFWPALLRRNLEITVSTWVGRTRQTRIPVDPEKFEPEYTEMLRKYEVRDFDEELTKEGDLVVEEITLNIPERTADPRHDEDAHSAVLLIRRDSSENEPANEVVYFRSPGMIVNRWSLRPPSLGGQPYRAVLIAGSAVDAAESSRLAEMFLRAAEPPAHDKWELTPDVKSSYRRGGGVSLRDFFEQVKNAVYENIKPSYTDEDNEGPQILAELLRIAEPPAPSERKPVLTIEDHRIEKDESWTVRASIGLPSVQGWHITPSLIFAAETGRGSEVSWLLEAVSGCVVEDGVLVIPPGSSKAEFIGRTDPATHPASSHETAADIVLKRIRRGE